MAFPRRLRILFLLTCVAFGLIWLRMVQLQTLDRSACAAIAQKKRQTTRTLRPPRGRIVDRQGALLAWDAPIRQVAIVGAEWESRARRRCPTCGTIHFHDPERRFRVRRCSCRTPASSFEEMSPPDLGPLAAALGIQTGELEKFADDRVAEIHAKADRLRASPSRPDRPDFLRKDQIEQLVADLMSRPFVYKTGEGRVLADVGQDVVRLIELDEVGQYRGFRILTALRRRYDPEGPAGQLLGLVSAVTGADELEALKAEYHGNVGYDTRIGRAGIERAMNEYLIGENGSQTLARDEDGAFTITVEETLPRRGMELTLTLDKAACRQADSVLEHWGKDQGYFPRSQPSGGLVAMRADTGEIVAWGELPRLVLARDLEHLYDPVERDARYDPALGQWLPSQHEPLREGETLEAFQRRISKPAPRHLSRVHQIAVEPGSTMKVFVGLAMLDGVRHMPAGTPLPLESRGRYFACDSLLVRTPGCHAHRDVDFVGAIEVSCNKYFAWSLKDFPRYWDVFRRTVPRYLENFGFGRPTCVDVAAESRGQFLRPWIDFDPREPIRTAAERLAAEDGIQLRLDLQAGVPERLAGRGPQRLATGLATAIRHAARAVGARQALLRVRGGERRFPYRDLDFRLLLPPLAAGPSAEEAAAKARANLLRYLHALGVEEDKEVDGAPGALAIGFKLTYHDRIHREPDEPAPLLAEDARNLAIGQGPVTTTPLQMVRAVAAIANGGTLVTPHVVAAADGTPFTYPHEPLGIPTADLERVRAGMRAVIYGSGGTARHTALKSLPGTVYGKTGTAQPSAWWALKQLKPEGVWHHWFVGFYEAPGRPPIAFACVLHARSEAAAGLTSANAIHDFLAWWARHA